MQSTQILLFCSFSTTNIQTKLFYAWKVVLELYYIILSLSLFSTTLYFELEFLSFWDESIESMASLTWEISGAFPPWTGQNSSVANTCIVNQNTILTKIATYQLYMINSGWRLKDKDHQTNDQKQESHLHLQLKKLDIANCFLQHGNQINLCKRRRRRRRRRFFPSFTISKVQLEISH